MKKPDTAGWCRAKVGHAAPDVQRCSNVNLAGLCKPRHGANLHNGRARGQLANLGLAGSEWAFSIFSP